MKRLSALLAVTLLLTGCGDDDNGFIFTPNLAQLVFTQPPQNGTAGTNLNNIVLQLQDQVGQVFPQANGQVTLTIGNNPGNAQLLQNGIVVPAATATGANGQVTFTNIAISAPGNGYTLVATATDPITGLQVQSTSPAFNIAPSGVTSAIFLRGQGDLWDNAGGDSDVAAMNAVFGVGNWTQANFETVNTATLFQPNQFIFMDGGDGTTNEFITFLNANEAAIEAWVTSGGRAVINAAPNEGPDTFGMTFDVTNDQTTDHDSVTLVPGHPITTASGATVVFTGGSFAHSNVLGGSISPIIRDTTVPAQIILGELNPGTGRVLFGGMTTTNFHDPDPQAAELRANILRYAAGIPLVPATVPAP